MKVAFLAPANSIHTQRWVGALCRRGHQVTVFSQHAAPPGTSFGGAEVELLPFGGGVGYFVNAFWLRARLSQLQPHLLNAHYASGYGTTASLSGFHPILLSVWGSDVYDFPYESRFKGSILRWNLRRASRIASTSHVMARQVRKLVPEIDSVLVTPFGVDCERFRPVRQQDADYITIGTVKTLAHKYGVDVLIDAFSRLTQDAQLRDAGIACRIRLLLVGGGKERDGLEALARTLGVRDKVTFVGQVDHGAVPDWLNRLDIYVAASRLDSESFGVAVVEASACGVPVVVSDVGGLPEVVRHGETGLVVRREDPNALATAIKSLLLDDDLRKRMGAAGREFAASAYEWEHCVDLMEAAFREVTAGGAS